MLESEYRLDSPRRSGGGRRLRLGAILLGLSLLSYLLWVKLERQPPVAELVPPIEFIGDDQRIGVRVFDPGTGISSVEISLEAAGTSYPLVIERHASVGWRGSDTHERTIHVDISPVDRKIPEGPASLVVRAADHSWWNAFNDPAVVLRHPVEIDTTPPGIEILTGQHYIHQGGSDLVIYRTSDDTVRSGVEVGDVHFPGYDGVLKDESLRVALFTVPQKLQGDVVPLVLAEDAAGNTRRIPFVAGIQPRHGRDRTLQLSKSFLTKKIPELLRLNRRPVTGEPIADYLEVNRELREASEVIIREAGEKTTPTIPWTQSFLRQPGAESLSLFADNRSYVFDGQKIDAQTHLGYDLASLRRSPIVSAGDGIVTFADGLGIYGETVIVDHGLGLSSLYGHMSSIVVSVGDQVKRGETIGRSGETGLAGGDHLHFSMMIRGWHVDPVEWWDAKWVNRHILRRIESFGGLAAGGGS